MCYGDTERQEGRGGREENGQGGEEAGGRKGGNDVKGDRGETG